jgi:competence protein ComEC
MPPLALVAEAPAPTRWPGARALFADWVFAERGRFFPWLPVFMTAGNAAYFAATIEPPAWLGAALLLPCAAAALALRRRAVLRAVFLSLAAASLGIAAAQLATARAPPAMEVPRKAVTVTGPVRAVEPLPEGVRVTIEAPSLDGAAPQPRTVRIRLRPEDPAAPVTGDTLRIRARLAPPNPPAYPGGWDLQRDAYFSGIGAYGYALSQVAVLGHADPSGVARTLQAMREIIAARIARVVDGPAGAICATLLTGSPAAIPAGDRAAFRDSGLAHLLAIAGLHIGIVMGLVFGLVRTLLALWEWAALRLPCKPIAAVAALAAGGFYMMLTGGHVPIIRSFAMACLVTLGILVGRRALSLRGLSLAMAALLLLAPEQAMGVSFQMSFSAVLALIAGYDALRPALLRLRAGGGWRRWLASHVTALALTSALAGTASAPFAAYHFGQVQLYNVLANVAAVPLTALWVMPAGLIALALMPLHLEFLALVPMGWGASAILWIGRAVSALPSATLMVPHMPQWGLACVAIGMAWLGIWRTRIRLAGLAPLALGLASPALIAPPDILLSADGRLAAIHAGGDMFVQQRDGFSGFTQDAWRQMWAARVRALPERPEQGVACDERACRLQLRADAPTAMLLLGAPSDADCAASLLLSLEPIHLRCPAPVPDAFDRFDLWRDGALAVWLTPAGARVLTDRQARGARPWVPEAPE